MRWKITRGFSGVDCAFDSVLDLGESGEGMKMLGVRNRDEICSSISLTSSSAFFMLGELDVSSLAFSTVRVDSPELEMFTFFQLIEGLEAIFAAE